MVFSSSIFVWIFLPIMLVGYYILPKKFKNIFLLLGSIFFYAWGEPIYIILMLGTIVINYLFGIIIDKIKKVTYRKIILIISVICNLGVLVIFKYFHFICDNLNYLVKDDIFSFKDIALPIGISFYTFQAMSYVIDVYRGDTKSQKNIIYLALYISFFPQLVAGPIVKYHDIEKQLMNRTMNFDRFFEGVHRFIYGLGKKMIISNTLGETTDYVFALDMSNLSAPIAWGGMICYTLQIYYDFSGYSDMAIGLGKMFGFEFMENFDYPYISQSIQEFWRKWHISLSTWFKEYLYIPLGGNRKGKIRTYVNLFIVFLCTGFWHGASWNFVLWGLFHGFFSILERLFLGKVLKQNKIKVVNNIYTMLVVSFAWILFRSNNLESAISYFKRMFSIEYSGYYSFNMIFTPYILIIIILGIILSGLVQKKIGLINKIKKDSITVQILDICLCICILAFSVIMLASGAYNPFIYFNF